MGALEAIWSVSTASCRTDTSRCMAAAMRLRNRPMWRSSRDELRRSAATSQLLQALGRALARGPTAVPPPVRRAALCLARECGDDSPSTTAEVDHDSDPDLPVPRRARAGSQRPGHGRYPSMRPSDSGGWDEGLQPAGSAAHRPGVPEFRHSPVGSAVPADTVVVALTAEHAQSLH